MPFINLHLQTHPQLSQVALPFRKSYADILDDQMNALTTIVHQKIRREAPVRTGNLRKSIVRRKRGQFIYDILVDKRMKGGKYEHYVRLGTSGPYAIFPRKKKALWWPGLPHPIKAVYNHPGIKANPYWDRGLDEAEADMSRAEELIGSKIERRLTEDGK